jgi:hypothetical protein
MLWAVMFYFVIRTLILGIRSKSWPATEGEIVASEVEKVKPTETGMIINKYRAAVQYTYTVKDVTYTSEVVSFGELAFLIFNRGLRSRKGAKQLVAKYPVGSVVQVYYEPGNPNRSLLEPGVSDPNLILTMLIFGIVGLLLIIPLFSLVS